MGAEEKLCWCCMLGVECVGEPSEESEARLLELWKTEDVADVEGDCAPSCG